MRLKVSISVVIAAACLLVTSNAQGNTRIINSPHPLYILPNGNLSLTCVQRQGRNVEWFHNGVVINENSRTKFSDSKRKEEPSLHTSTTLTKPNITEEDSGIYTCRALMDPRRPEWEMSEYNIEVKMSNNPTPEYTSILAHNALADKPKDDVDLRCSTTGDQFDGATLTWMRNDDTIRDNSDKYRLRPENNTLHVKSVDYLEDLGEYQCVFALTSGSDESATVLLQAKTYVNSFDMSKNLVQGDTLTLRCDAYGYPAPSAHWLKNDDVIVVDDRTSFEDYRDVVNGTVKTRDVDYPDAGDYTCVAENDHGSHNSTIIIRVKDKFAALWPFLGICAEVLILCIIIFIYERRRAKKMAAEDAKEEADHLTNSHGNRDDVRQRKV